MQKNNITQKNDTMQKNNTMQKNDTMQVQPPVEKVQKNSIYNQ